MSSSKNSEENHFDVVVLGAGISGLVCASVLARRKPQRILIIEEYSHVGEIISIGPGTTILLILEV